MHDGGNADHVVVAGEAGVVSGAVLAERYELGDVLGAGGAAVVYRASDLRLSRQVAVKVFNPGMLAPEESPHRTEVTTLAGLRHPGLVALHDAGTAGAHAYLVMQLVDGETLSRRISRAPLSLAAAARVGAGLAATLAYVHERGVIHRDVKPGNVLLDAEQRPYLADFGIARLIDATRVTATGLVAGTPAYLAPEQVRGLQVGPAADVYALGLVLLEALSGRREYPGGGVESAVARLHRPPEVLQHLPASLGSLLTAMTADDPDARPSAADVAARIETAAADNPVADNPAPATTPRAALWRNPRMLLRTSAVGVALAATVLGVTLTHEPGSSPLPAAAGTSTATDQERVSESPTPPRSPSPDPGTAALVASDPGQPSAPTAPIDTEPRAAVAGGSDPERVAVEPAASAAGREAASPADDARSPARRPGADAAPQPRGKDKDTSKGKSSGKASKPDD